MTLETLTRLTSKTLRRRMNWGKCSEETQFFIATELSRRATINKVQANLLKGVGHQNNPPD